MPVYDKEGNEITDVTTVLSADEIHALVTASPEHQKALGEAIERRKALKELKAQLAASQPEPDEPVVKEDKPDKKTEVSTVKPVDEDALVEKALQRLRAEQQATQARDALIKKVMKENNLPLDNSKFYDAVAIAQNEEAMRTLAAALAQANMRVDNSTAGGNGETINFDRDALFASLDKQIFKDKSGNK